MLLVAALLVYVFLISYTAGILVYAALQKVYTDLQRPPLTLLVISGWAAINFILLVAHLFFPIHGYLHITIALPILIAVFSKTTWRTWCIEPFRNTEPKQWILPIILGLIAIMSICNRPGIGDIADYHLQAVRWAENFSMVPGIGNYNRPLANNNGWFHLQAFFGLRDITHQSTYVLNAWMFVLVMYYLVQEIRKNPSSLFLWILFVFTAFTSKTAFIGSITPDIIITEIVFVFAVYLKFGLKRNSDTIWLWILAVFALSIKLNSILLAVSIVFLPLLPQLTFSTAKYLRYYVLFATIYLLPWFAGNIVRSGWLCYPIQWVDLFSFDWKIPTSVLKHERFSILQWGKFPGHDIYDTARMSIGEWLPHWFQSYDAMNKGLLILLPLSILFAFLYRIIRHKKLAQNDLFLIALSIAGTAFCFMNGPHIRYAFGFMLVLLAWNIQYITESFAWKIPRQMILAWISISYIMVVFSSVRSIESTSLTSYLLVPKAYPNATPESYLENRTELGIVHQTNQCWDQFACSYYMVDGCSLRDGNIAHGFRIR